jgi:hypothetical protein
MPTATTHIYLIAEPDKMAEVLAQAPAIYGNVGLKLGYGSENTEIILPARGYDREEFPYLPPRRSIRPSPPCRHRIQDVPRRPP